MREARRLGSRVTSTRPQSSGPSWTGALKAAGVDPANAIAPRNGKYPNTGHFKSNYVRWSDEQPELTALKNVEKRELVARLLLADLRLSGLEPMRDRVVICGDLNTDVYQERFQGERTVPGLVRAGFYNNLDDFPAGERVTIPAKQNDPNAFPDAVFDYILSSRALGRLPVRIVKEGAALRHGVGPGDVGHASDHYMVVVTCPSVDQ